MRDALHGGGPQQLGDLRLGAGGPARGAQGELPQRAEPEDLRLHVRVGEGPLHARIPDRTGGGGLRGELVHLTPDQREDARVGRAALIGERGHGDFPPPAGTPKQVPGRNLDVIEEARAGGFGSVGRPDVVRLDPWRAHVDEQDRDRLATGLAGLGSRQQEAPVRVGGAAGPQFLPVDHVAVAVADGPGAEARKV